MTAQALGGEMPDHGREDPADWSFQRSRDRYLNRRGADSTDASIDGWWYRLKLFIEWCEGIGLDHVGELRPIDLDEYYDIRAGEVKPVTLEGEMWTLHGFIEYLESMNAVPDGLTDAVRIPDVDADERSSDVKLATDAAFALLRYYRNSDQEYGTRAHAVLELAWYTGARQGGLRALDIRDVYIEDNYVDFRHRPDEGTPLKNKIDGERPVGLPNTVMEVLEHYQRHERHDVTDAEGRAPFLASQAGRPTSNTLRIWSYMATQPCLHSSCPHGHERETCEYVERAHASKCPSSRAPHHIRTGSITWQLNLGFPVPVVAERVNASVQTIKNHYDKADRQERRRRKRQQMERTRREYVAKMEDPDQ